VDVALVVVGKGVVRAVRRVTTAATNDDPIMKHTLLLLISLATSVFAYERLQGPTELLYWDKTNAYNGYTLFGSHGTTYLIDMAGQVVHTWRLGTNPRFLDNGNILDASKDDPSGFQGFVEVDWDGRKVWEYTEQRENYAPHHDWARIFNKKLNNHGFFSQIGCSGQRLPNGNTLVCSDTEGHFFEVTASNKLVWEYINPVTKEFGTVKILSDALPMVNSAFRAYRYGPDHPALQGKDLKLLGTITEAFPRQPDPRAKERRPPGQGGQRRGGGRGPGGGGQGGGGRGGPGGGPPPNQ